MRHINHSALISLRGKVQRLETEGRQRWQGQSVISTGTKPLDQLLPSRGLVRGTLVEWILGADRSSGAGVLALRAACEAARDGGYVIVFDRQHCFFPPAAAAWGLDLKRLVVIRASSVRDELWALDQALRCRAVAAVWGGLEELDWRWFRRLQLSAEQGGTLGLLLRPARARGQPSWADVQWQVTPVVPKTERSQQSQHELQRQRSLWQLSVTLNRCRGGAIGRTVQVSIGEQYRDDSTNSLPLAASLADPATGRAATGT
ncbi:MAG: hypothetical protein VB878_22925 [Pirellulaceae bacterium]|jgi:hypothetical protein